MVYTLSLMKDGEEINQYDEFSSDFITALQKANLPIDRYIGIWHKMSKGIALDDEEFEVIDELFLGVGAPYTVFREAMISETGINDDGLMFVFNRLAMGIISLNIDAEEEGGD